MLSILLIDNHDSFTYNLVELFRQTKLCKTEVVLLEKATEINFYEYDGVVLSPGPGLPSEKQELRDIIKIIEGKIPLLGVCLGHQALVEFYGGSLLPLDRIIHGESSNIKISSTNKFYAGLSQTMAVGRYHSWIVNDKTFPDVLSVTSKTEEGLIMSFVHNTKNVNGVQFHPESILTPQGKMLLQNWLTYCVGKPN